MAVKYSFKVKLTSVGGGFLFFCFCEVCVFVLVVFFVFWGNIPGNAHCGWGSYASITIEVSAFSSFLRFLPHIAPHRSHCLQLLHGWSKRYKNFSSCWPDCTYRQSGMILVLRGALEWICHGIPIHSSGIELHIVEWQRTKTAFLFSSLFM